MVKPDSVTEDNGLTDDIKELFGESKKELSITTHYLTVFESLNFVST